MRESEASLGILLVVSVFTASCATVKSPMSFSIFTPPSSEHASANRVMSLMSNVGLLHKIPGYL